MTDVPESLALLRDVCAAHGFDVAGVTSAAPLTKALPRLVSFCERGFAADMGWMARNPPERADPRTLLPTARSVVTLAVPHVGRAPPFDPEKRYGRVARYAWGRDYHDVLLPRLHSLGEALVETLSGATRFKALCDHSPFLERAAASRAGLGFLGKNTCLIRPRHGSFLFLAEILLDVEIPATSSKGVEHCGSCARCLDDCPTRALVDPYVLDSRRCISYLTIEHRGPIPRGMREALGAWVFGCDDCQETCPFNRYEDRAILPDLEASAGAGSRLDLTEVLSIARDEDFRDRFADTPLLRPKRAGLLRNAAVAARNVGATSAVDALARCVREDPSPLVRQHALWALFGLAPQVAVPLAETARRDDVHADVREEAAAGLQGG